MATQRWSRDLVVREIRDLEVNQADLRHSEVSQTQRKLVSAAIRYFGSWGAAVTAAGIDYAAIRRRSQDARSVKVTKWCKESISEEIKKIIAAGESLAAATVRENHPALFSAAVSSRYFGSWRSAITAQGIDYDTLLSHDRGQSTAPRDARGLRTILRRLKALEENVRDLTGDQVQARYPRFYEKVRAHFDTWEDALQAAFGRNGETDDAGELLPHDRSSTSLR